MPAITSRDALSLLRHHPRGFRRQPVRRFSGYNEANAWVYDTHMDEDACSCFRVGLVNDGGYGSGLLPQSTKGLIRMGEQMLSSPACRN
ncbi:hypothetical protein GCM10023084_82750 [Streptomyces lacrimifluminis]